MPSSIIEEPRARSAKTVRPPQRPAGSSSVPSTGNAWKGTPAATVPRRGIVTADPSSTATSSHPAFVAASMIPLLPGTPYLGEEMAKVNGAVHRVEAGPFDRRAWPRPCEATLRHAREPPANLLITGPPG